MSFVVEKNKSFYPADICFFCFSAVMVYSEVCAYLIEKFLFFSKPIVFTRRGGNIGFAAFQLLNLYVCLKLSDAL
jgi:hypothetical protein